MVYREEKIFNLQFNWRSFISQYPRIYSAWKGLRAPAGTVGISKQATDLVLEGYPRSGNTFVWYAFMMAQTCPYNIVRHSHMPARVIEAVKLEIPTLVLIRNPKDCVLSYCVYEPRLSFKMGLIHWIRLYQTIKPYQRGYVLANFDQIITDFGQVIASVNERFGTQFDIFDHTPENERRVFEKIEFRTKIVAKRLPYHYAWDDRIGRPSEIRKQKIKEYEAELLKNRQISKLLNQAEDLYTSLLAP